MEVVRLLEQYGADIHGRTNKGRGWTPLNLARKAHGDSHPLVQYFREKGAADLEPEL